MLTIPKRMTHGDELVVVRRQDYEKMQKYFTEVKDILAKILQSEKELKEGKAIKASSVKEALKIYARKQH